MRKTAFKNDCISSASPIDTFICDFVFSFNG